MYRRRNHKTVAYNVLVKLSSRLRVADSADANKRVIDPASLQLSHQRVVAEHFHPEHLSAPQLSTYFKQAGDLILLHRAKYFDHDLRVAARAEADNRNHYPTPRTSMTASAYTTPIVAPRTRANA